MNWKDSGNSDAVFVATFNYSPANDQHQQPFLPLVLGDIVHIRKECDDWYYGFLDDDTSKCGTFPKAFVAAARVATSDESKNNGSAAFRSNVVDEVVVVLREWCKTCKSRFRKNEKHDLLRVFDLIKDILNWRQQILSKKLSNEEVKKLKAKIGLRIDIGNKILGADLVVRNSTGSELQTEYCSAIELYNYHVAASGRIAEEMRVTTREDKSPGGSYTQGSWNVLLTFLDFLCPCTSKLEISFLLYDAREGNFISECFTIILPYYSKQVNGDTTRNSAIGNQDQRILFTDLGTKDLEREHLFLLCRVVKIGPLETKDTPGSRRGTSSALVRQMYGIGLLNLSDFLKTKQFLSPGKSAFYPMKSMRLPEDPEEKQSFVTLYSLQDESIDQLIKKLTESSYMQGEGDIKSQGLYLSVQFLCGNLDEVKSTYAHLFTPMPALIRKMGFPEVIFRDDVRNDLYVTLVGGDFSHCGRSDKNIEVRVCLIDENATQEVPNSISIVGSKTFKENHYLSTVYYHQDKPRWCETVKFSIPVEQYSTVHVQFTFKHRSSNESKDKAEKPFAIAFIRLRQSEGTVLHDGQHDMLVYRLERKYDESDFSYRTLPATKADLDMSGWSGMASKSMIQSPTGGFVLSSKDYFTIRSIVCSTSLTQNVDLLGLLDWESKRVNLKHSLEALMKAEGDRGGEEIVKFLQHILDALFSVLINTNDYDQLVFDALVYVIGLVGERRYHNFKPVMDTYLHSHFSAALAYQKLIPILKDYVDSIEESGGKLLKALKSLEYLVKFIVKSRDLYMQLKGPTAGHERFQSLLRALLVSISSLMLCRRDQSLLCQGAALKYMPCIIGDVITIFDAEELSMIMVDFVRNVPEDRLTKQKMMCLQDLVHSDLITNPQCRSIVLPVILESVRFQIEGNDELDICAAILSDLIRLLRENHFTSSLQQSDLTVLSDIILRPVVQAVIRLMEKKDAAQLGQFSALLLSLLEEMDAGLYRFYVMEFTTRTDLMDFTLELLMLFKDLMCNQVFQRDWFQMVYVRNSVILKILCYLATTIKARFMHEKFEREVCEVFFQTAVTFITQDELQLEQFSAKKRNAIIEKFRDMRLTCARELVRSMWFSMNLLEKNYFIPSLVGAILEVTLISVEEVRKLTIPIFFDMMVTEYYLRANSTEGSFNSNSGAVIEFEKELIKKIDVLIERGKGDTKYIECFKKIMLQLCSSQVDSLCAEGIRITKTVERLLKRLFEFREVREYHDNINNRISCTVSLLHFYNEIGHLELYVRYLAKLFQLHMQRECYTEAALTLSLHADCLEWSDSPLDPVLKHPLFPMCKTERELKEAVMHKIIDLLDKGELWEKAIGFIQELQQEYERNTFEYDKLSSLLDKMSRMYRNILKHQRAEPEYFRVAFYGRGFPNFLQNLTFVYRGTAYERLADFTSRIQAQYPAATLMNSLNPPTTEIMESNKQYLQINKLDPVYDDQLKRFRKRTVDSHILWYYRYNEVQKFSFSRRISKPGQSMDGFKDEMLNEFGLMWLERTFLVTSYRLPGILEWFPAASESRIQLSPSAVAVESMTSANDQLERLIEDAERFGEKTIKPLAAKLQGMLNPAVMGGIKNYEQAFFTSEFYAKADQTTKENVNILKDRISSQIPLLEKGVFLHGEYCSEEQIDFHNLLVKSFHDYKRSVEEKYGSKPRLLPDNCTLHFLKPLQRQASLDPTAIQDQKSLSLSSTKKQASHSEWHSSTSNPWSLRQGGFSSFSSTVPRRLHNSTARYRRKTNQSASDKDHVSKRLSSHSTGSAANSEVVASPIPASPVTLTEKLVTTRPPRPESVGSRISVKQQASARSSFDGLPSGPSSEPVSFSASEEETCVRSSFTPPPLPPRPCNSSSDLRHSGELRLSQSSSFQRMHATSTPKKEKPLPPLPTPP